MMKKFLMIFSALIGFGSADAQGKTIDELKAEREQLKLESSRNDPREYARLIAPIYATSPDYADTLIAVMNDVERIAWILGYEK
jgi:flagellum-specific peptidoglycan hydrolase FlgJ